MIHEHSAAAVRSIFISDLHLGSRFSKASEMLEFLKKHRPENLYLVGDFIDAWALRRRWYWPQPYNDLFNHIALLVESGTNLFYTPGNHDSFLRSFQVNEPPIRIQDQFLHRCVDGRQMIVLHGDQFDRVESGAKWLSVIGSVAYDAILTFDRSFNRLLAALGFSPRRISATLKQTVKRTVQFFSGFEDRLLEHAREASCDIIICGHIHVPRYRMLEEVLYVNLGDWIENSTALVEYADGRLELLDTSARKVTSPRRKRVRESHAVAGLSPLAARLASQLLSAVHDDTQANGPQASPLENAVA
jgi:UDP-2,3-diacylglucosamine pyrophosphatase LpxH